MKTGKKITISKLKDYYGFSTCNNVVQVWDNGIFLFERKMKFGKRNGITWGYVLISSQRYWLDGMNCRLEAEWLD